MNTDNMAISGETIDYGPCAFMNAYDPATVFSSIDHGGRYAYGNQPPIAQWNLARFAEALLPLLDADRRGPSRVRRRRSSDFRRCSSSGWLAGMRAKLGLFTEEPGDTALVDDLLDWMQRTSADFTNTFRDLSTAALADEATKQDPEFDAWHRRLDARRTRQPQSRAEVPGADAPPQPGVHSAQSQGGGGAPGRERGRPVGDGTGCSTCSRHRTTTGATCRRSAHLATAVAAIGPSAGRKTLTPRPGSCDSGGHDEHTRTSAA